MMLNKQKGVSFIYVIKECKIKTKKRQDNINQYQNFIWRCYIITSLVILAAQTLNQCSIQEKILQINPKITLLEKEELISPMNHQDRRQKAYYNYLAISYFECRVHLYAIECEVDVLLLGGIGKKGVNRHDLKRDIFKQYVHIFLIRML